MLSLEVCFALLGKKTLRENVCDLFGRKVSTVINDFLTHRNADILHCSHTQSEMHMHTYTQVLRRLHTGMWFIMCNLL